MHVDDGGDPADNAFLYVNGVLAASWDHQFNTIVDDAGNLGGGSYSRIALGEEIAELGNVQLDVAAVLVFDQALTQIERQVEETALEAKFLTPPQPGFIEIPARLPATEQGSREVEDTTVAPLSANAVDEALTALAWNPVESRLQNTVTTVTQNDKESGNVDDLSELDGGLDADLPA